MPINMNSPFVRAEVVPQSINDMGTRLKAHYGVGADSFGSKGNEYHSYGYHRSRQWILLDPDSRYGTRDYSVQTSRDNGGSEHWIRAFDFTPGEWGTAENRRRMIEITTRVYNAAKARDPRLRNMREFAGTINGKNVITFNCADGSRRDPFDVTHLDHCHGSLYTDTADADHSGIVDIMLGEDDDMGASFGPVQILRVDDGPTSLAIPPVNAGLADPRKTWLNIGADMNGGKAAVRIWASNGGKPAVWRPVGSGDGLHVIESGEIYSIELNTGDRLISVNRWSLDTNGHPITPGQPGASEPYNGSLSACFERQ